MNQKIIQFAKNKITYPDKTMNPKQYSLNYDTYLEQKKIIIISVILANNVARSRK